MSKHLLTAASGAILILASGCHYTRIARPETSSEMQDWEAVILESYPGYTPPPTSTRVVRSQNPAPRRPAPMDALADIPAEQPAAPEVLPAEQPAAETPAAPAEQPATEAPAEQPAAETPEAPAVVEIPADPAAETPAAETPAAETPAAETPAAETPAAPAEQPAAETPAAPAEQPAAQTPSGQTPPDPTNSTVYEVKAGDTLGSIAQSVYGDARYSNVIFRANTDILQDPNKLRPGMKLIVPKL